MDETNQAPSWLLVEYDGMCLAVVCRDCRAELFLSYENPVRLSELTMDAAAWAHECNGDPDA